MKRHLRDPAAAIMSSTDLVYCSGSQLSLVWLVSICDPRSEGGASRLRQPTKESKTKKGWLSILEPSREAREPLHSGFYPYILYQPQPSPQGTTARCLLPPPSPYSKGPRSEAKTAHGEETAAMGIPKVRQERERRCLPQHPWASPAPSPLLQASFCSQTLGYHHKGFPQFLLCHPPT